MPRPRVHVKVTFLLKNAGKAPSVFIKSPDDISEHVGVVTCKEYEQLKARLVKIEENIDNVIYFHKGSLHVYRFDESALPNRGIYGLKERRKDNSNSPFKVTAIKLVPIKSTSDFEKKSLRPRR